MTPPQNQKPAFLFGTAGDLRAWKPRPQAASVNNDNADNLKGNGQ
jgi:hypothetical protein